MSAAFAQAAAAVPDAVSWTKANRDLVAAELARLRLLLQRRVAWLRRHWAVAAAADGLGWRITDAEADRLLTGAERTAEAQFYASDDCNGISRALALAADEIAARRRALQDADAPASLDVIGHVFGLSVFEREVLLLALAPELDGTFERLYAYVQDDLGRRHATADLAVSLLLRDGDDTGEACERLGPHGALRRNRLIVLDEATPTAALPHRPLRVEERIVEFVRGVNRPDSRVEHLLEPTAPALLAGADQTIVAQAADWLRVSPRQLFGRAVNLIGPPGARQVHLARSICDAIDIGLARLDAATLLASAVDRRELVALIEREAALLNLAFYVEPAAAACEAARPLTRELDRLRAPMFVATQSGWQTAREVLTVAVSRPGAAERTELWQGALTRAGFACSDDAIAPVVEQFDIGADEIAAAVAAAGARAALRGSRTAVNAAELWAVCRERIVPGFDELAQRVVPCYGWDDIVLPPDSAEQLRDIADQVAHRATVYRNWGFGAKLSRGQGISALFAGPSGTGKTMAAEILAGTLALDLYRIDLAGVVSKYIGETEKNLRRIFDAAEAGGAVLFFDEADALFGKRSEVKDSHDRYANIEVNYLLQRMEDFRGLAILATNRRAALDSAFTRRLRFIVEFPFPGARQRLEIWRKVFPPDAALQGVDFAWLARLEIPGGSIRNIALAAAFLAAAEGGTIAMRHVIRSARREFVKMERLVPDAEFAPFEKAAAE
jgi:hypothetical protein